jgi:hypothetical protein
MFSVSLRILGVLACPARSTYVHSIVSQGFRTGSDVKYQRIIKSGCAFLFHENNRAVVSVRDDDRRLLAGLGWKLTCWKGSKELLSEAVEDVQYLPCRYNVIGPVHSRGRLGWSRAATCRSRMSGVMSPSSVVREWYFQSSIFYCASPDGEATKATRQLHLQESSHALKVFSCRTP